MGRPFIYSNKLNLSRHKSVSGIQFRNFILSCFYLFIFLLKLLRWLFGRWGFHSVVGIHTFFFQRDTQLLFIKQALEILSQCEVRDTVWGKRDFSEGNDNFLSSRMCPIKSNCATLHSTLRRCSWEVLWKRSFTKNSIMGGSCWEKHLLSTALPSPTSQPSPKLLRVLKFPSGSSLGCNNFITGKNTCGLVRWLSLCTHVCVHAHTYTQC